MKKIADFILSTIVHTLVGIDNVLYRTFGYVSCFRRHKWNKQAGEIQVSLNYQHSRRDRFNKINGTNWTTKRVMNEIGI